MSDAPVLLDASAVLALLFDEPGSARVAEILPDAVISAVNLAEVVAKLHDRGVSKGDIAENLRDLDLPVVPFDEAAAIGAGMLRAETRAAGLSLGDRACLATAAQGGLPVLTADRTWAELGLAVAVEVLR